MIISSRSKQKKLGSYDTSNRLYGRKRTKVWIFEKSTLKIRLVYGSKIPIFEVNFFQRVLKNFLRVVQLRLIYLEGFPRSYLYSRKKIGVMRHIDQKILTKNRFALKKTVWNNFPLYHCRNLCNVQFHVDHTLLAEKCTFELLNAPKVSDQILARFKLHKRIEWIESFSTLTLKLIYDKQK